MKTIVTMKTIASIILTAICFVLSVSCSNQKTKTVAKSVDSTLYITKDIKLYANIDTLLKNSIISPSVTGASKYIANSNYLFDIEFQEADVNFGDTKSDSLRNIAYGIYVPIDSMQIIYGKLYRQLVRKYNSPNKIKNPTSEGDRISNAVWHKKGMVVILNSTIPENESKGVVCVVFTTPKDTIYYDAFMR